jgi:hypothetical protein
MWSNMVKMAQFPMVLFQSLIWGAKFSFCKEEARRLDATSK